MNLQKAGRMLDLFEAFAREGEPLSPSGLVRAISAPTPSRFGVVRILRSAAARGAAGVEE